MVRTKEASFGVGEKKTSDGKVAEKTRRSIINGNIQVIKRANMKINLIPNLMAMHC